MRNQCLLAVVGLAASVAAAGPEIRTDVTGARAVAYIDTGDSGQTNPSTRGASDWAAMGPYGGDIQDVAVSPIDPNIMLAAHAPGGSSGGALYRSTNGGQTWAQVSTVSISCFDIEFAADGTAYVGSMDGVQKSTDGGATWTALNLGIGLNDQTFDVALHPTDPNTMYAGVADALGFQTNVLMKTTDGGQTWFSVTPPLSGAMSCSTIAIDPANPETVVAGFAGAFGGGEVWVSTDGGSSWNYRSGILPGNPINDIEFSNGRLLLAGGQLFGSQFVGVWESTDLGITWNALHDGSWPTEVVDDLAIDPNNPAVIYAATPQGLFRSTDSGATWSFGVGDTGSLSLNAVRFAPGSSGHIVLGGDSVGIYQSTDSGASFNSTSVGIGALDVYSIAANPLDGDEIAIAFQGANNGGVYRSTDGGQTWSIENLPGTRYNTVAYSPTGVLYAISDGPTGIAPEGLYRRNNDGTYTNIGPDQGTLFESELFAITFSETNPDLIITAGSDFGVAGHEPTVWVSTDAGATWAKTYEGIEASHDVLGLGIVGDGTDSTIIASIRDVSGARTGGLIRSTDGGQTWSDSTSGLPFEFQGDDIAPSAEGPEVFYVTNNDNTSAQASGGLFKTTDGGQTWSATGLFSRAVYVATDPSDGQVIYVTGANTEKVQVSTDGGATFSLFDSGLSAVGAGTPRDLAFSADGTPRLLMAASTGSYSRTLGEACAADFNGDGTLTLSDFVAFRNAYTAGDMHADFDGSGTLTLADFVAFRNAYTAGCP